MNEEVLLREGDTDLEENDLALEEPLLEDTYERLVFEREERLVILREEDLVDEGAFLRRGVTYFEEEDLTPEIFLLLEEPNLGVELELLEG